MGGLKCITESTHTYQNGDKVKEKDWLIQRFKALAFTIFHFAKNHISRVIIQIQLSLTLTPAI